MQPTALEPVPVAPDGQLAQRPSETGRGFLGCLRRMRRVEMCVVEGILDERMLLLGAGEGAHERADWGRGAGCYRIIG